MAVMSPSPVAGAARRRTSTHRRGVARAAQLVETADLRRQVAAEARSAMTDPSDPITTTDRRRVGRRDPATQLEREVRRQVARRAPVDPTSTGRAAAQEPQAHRALGALVAAQRETLATRAPEGARLTAVKMRRL